MFKKLSKKKIVYTVGLASLLFSTSAMTYVAYTTIGSPAQVPTPKTKKTEESNKSNSSNKFKTSGFNIKGLDPKVLKLSLQAYGCARAKGQVKNPMLTIIDYSKPSTEKRMWVVDMRTKQVKLNELVAHGSGSGGNYAKSFSNASGSHRSSIGVFQTKQTYYGHKGLSLRLDGLEKGYNDHAYSRAVVIHGANYATQAFVNKVGRLGRSWGCPAVSPALAKKTINTIKGGSIVFAYYPNKKWLKESSYLHCTVA